MNTSTNGQGSKYQSSWARFDISLLQGTHIFNVPGGHPPAELRAWQTKIDQTSESLGRIR
jgi:hypothetical protein